MAGRRAGQEKVRTASNANWDHHDHHDRHDHHDHHDQHDHHDRGDHDDHCDHEEVGSYMRKLEVVHKEDGGCTQGSWRLSDLI